MGVQRLLTKVAVLGAGTMGSRIAAHLANAGVAVVLLDRVPPETAADAGPAARNKFGLVAMDGLKKARPAAFYVAEVAGRITVGNFEDDLALVAGCDWIIEAVAENLEIKRALLVEVLKHRRPGTITTTNTSGLRIAEIVAGLDEDLERHWFGVHFFNPPRYMRLVEVIATEECDAADVALIAEFCDRRLGKTIVASRDTPNFIANRVGTFTMLNAIRLMMEQGLTVEEVDALTGAALGWPKTGTFRLGDLVGVDVLANVARNFASQADRVRDERKDVGLPEFIGTMLKNGWLGDKVGQGFYKKTGKDAQGRDVRMVMDWRTAEYGPTTRPKIPALEMAKAVERTGDRVAQLLGGNAEKEKAAKFYWPLLTELFTYAANRISGDGSEPARSCVEIDRAMKAGFNWELGPFEMMDAVGPRAMTDRMNAEGREVAANVTRLLEHGESWYKDDPTSAAGRQYFDPIEGVYKPVVVAAGVRSLAVVKKSHGVVKKNPGASLVDLGDGVGAIELHSKMNALGGDIVSFVSQVLKPTSDAVRDFNAFVITGDSANFSVGANLMQLLMSVQDEEWDEIELAVRQFQGMTQAIKFCPRPVVVAPYGMCLGGGVEMSLHAAARQPHAELYMGLVEAGVGLIPGGGGCKEMLLRTVEAGTSIRPDARGEGVEIFEALKKNFETIAKATVSTSASEARGLGFLRASDGITMNRERLVTDAAARALSLAEAGYGAPMMRADIPAPGESALATLKLAVWTMREGGYISEHDAKVANHAANILCGGKVAPGTLVSEQYLLDLERAAFMSLCGEKKTQERIAFTLKTGKPLRN
jgi:3-hydroxyacyl-CoA dehydrogenase